MSENRIPNEKIIPSTMTLQRKDAKTITQPHPPSGGAILSLGVKSDPSSDSEGDDENSSSLFTS